MRSIAMASARIDKKSQILGSAAAAKKSADKEQIDIIYYPGKFEDGVTFFGHMAIGKKELNKNNYSTYLSYGMGDSVPNAVDDQNRYKNKPVIITLPIQDEAIVKRAIESFEKIKREDYNVITNNCAHAVAKFLNVMGYDVSPEQRGLTPHTLSSQLCDEEAQHLRRVSFHSDVSYLDKLKDVISIEKNRLVKEMKVEEFSVDSKLQLKAKKTKIHKLDLLEKSFMESEENNSAASAIKKSETQAFRANIMTFVEEGLNSLGDRTAQHLRDVMPTLAKTQKEFLEILYIVIEKDRGLRGKLKSLPDGLQQVSAMLKNLNAGNEADTFNNIALLLRSKSEGSAFGRKQAVQSFYDDWSKAADSISLSVVNSIEVTKTHESSKSNLSDADIHSPDSLSDEESLSASSSEAEEHSDVEDANYMPITRARR
jgi:hypothetical protein